MRPKRRPRSNRNVGNDDAATAFHEAGHAVVSSVERIRVREISIEPDGDSDGRVRHRSPLQGINLDIDVSDRSRLKMERIVRAFLAGQIAQARFSKGSLRPYQSADDLQTVVHLLAKFVGSSKELQAYLNLLSVQTEALVKEHWTAIRSVARALIRQRRLAPRDFRKIIEASERPLRASPKVVETLFPEN